MSLSSITSSINSAASSINSLLPASATVSPPSSQKEGVCSIGFLLYKDFSSNAKPEVYKLNIRPEELTRVNTSRATVQQTLGGAWCDDFGQGLTTTTISGHTGWRGNQNGDGLALFAALKNQVFTKWHEYRNAAVLAGTDPKNVRLYYADVLNLVFDVVIPLNFTLRRSKSRPLLAQYNISMISVQPDKVVKNKPTTSSSGLVSLLSSIKNLISAVKNVVKFVQSYVSEVAAFIQTATTIFQQVSQLVSQVQSIPNELLGAAKSMAQAGATMFATIASIGSNTSAQSAAAMATSSDFSNIFCLLNNTVNQQTIYPDYTPLYGASNCSSTNGGSPVSPYIETNPFYAVAGFPQYTAQPATSQSTAPVMVVASSTPVVSITPSAQQSLTLINSSDPVLAPIAMKSLGIAANSIATGVSIK